MSISRNGAQRQALNALRLLALVLALPLPLSALPAAPAHAAPSPTPSASGGITASGAYSPGGEGCHGSGNAADCLTWELVIPSAAVNHQDSDITIEVDSVPGQWEWRCRAEDRVAGSSAFYTRAYDGAPITRFSSTGLGFFDHLRYGKHGDHLGRVSSVSCTPGRLSLTYHVDFSSWSQDSYLILEDIGTTVVAPGSGERAYSFAPSITTSQSATPVTPTATAVKPAQSDAHATVTTERVTVQGEAKDAGRYAVQVRNDSSTPLSDFTVSGSVASGQASAASLACDLSAFGGGPVSDTAPSDGISLHSGKASLPTGQSTTCYLEATGVAGRNTISASLTTAAGQTFTGDYQDDRPDVEVSVQADTAVQVQPADPIIAGGSPYARVTYTVTFTNRTDVDTTTSDVVLRPQAPEGFALDYVTAEGAYWFRPLDPFLPGDDGSVRLGGSIPIGADSSATLTLHAIYKVDVDAVTRSGGWEALSTCAPGDSSKGMRSGLEITAGHGIQPATHTTCTAVTRPAGQ